MEFDLRLLRHALALADQGRFGAAAQALGLSQPALTRSIQELERRAGTRLFHRSRAGARPTDAGELLLSRARGLVAQADELARSMRALGAAGAWELRIGAGPYPAEMILGPVLARLADRHREAAFNVVLDQFTELVRRLGTRELDLAVCESSLIPEGSPFEVLPLVRHPGLLVCRSGHPLARRRRVPLEQALAWPLVLSGRLPPRVLAPLAQARAEGGREQAHLPELACPSLALMKQVVASGDALALLPPLAVEAEVARGELAVVRCRQPWMHTAFAVVLHRERGPAEAVDELVEELRAEDAELARREQPALRRLLA